jgi:hypothetical protein
MQGSEFSKCYGKCMGRMMDKASALRFRDHILHALEELSSALLVAQKACSEEEFIAARKPIGDIVARMGNLLRELSMSIIRIWII